MKDEQTTPQRGFCTVAAATYTSLSESFLQKARIGATECPGPRWRKVGNRVIYLKEDLDDWLNAQPSAQ